MLPQGCWLGPIQLLYCLRTRCFCLESSYLSVSAWRWEFWLLWVPNYRLCYIESNATLGSRTEYSCPSFFSRCKMRVMLLPTHAISHNKNEGRGEVVKEKLNTLIRYQYYHCLCDMHLHFHHSSKIAISSRYVIKIKIQSVCLINVAAAQSSFFASK